MDPARRLNEIRPLITDLVRVDSAYLSGNSLQIGTTPYQPSKRLLAVLGDRLATAGDRHGLTWQANGSLILTIRGERRTHIPWLNIVLFVLTLITVYLVPVHTENVFQAESATEAWRLTLQDLAAGKGLVFTIALISILLIHEMGHFVAGRRRGMATSWPFFIPAVNIIGTFGAVIMSKSPFQNRRDLIEMAAAGPIAGWLVALGWLVVGIGQSTLIETAGQSVEGGMLGYSLIFGLLVDLLLGAPPDGFSYLISEAAFAGWVGLLVTALNLLPIGQLDGGHITYGVFPRYQPIVARGALIGLFALGFLSPIWWIFAVFGFLTGIAHPPTLDDHRPLTPTTVAFAIISLAIMILSFTPVPLS